MQALIEEGTVDCYNEYEEYSGLLTMIQDNVKCPFKAKVVGEEVEVIEFQDVGRGFGIQAICKRNGKRTRSMSARWSGPRRKPKVTSGSRRASTGERA